MPRKSAEVRQCPNCHRDHLKINGITSAGNAQWVCRADRAAPDREPGCGYSETPDRVVPLSKAERNRQEWLRRKARKAMQEGDPK